MVQGVGFRFTAENIAQSMKVCGWVKNLSDGRVELVAEGNEKIVLNFLAKIRNGILRNYIRDEEISWSDAAEDLSGFAVRSYR